MLRVCAQLLLAGVVVLGAGDANRGDSPPSAAGVVRTYQRDCAVCHGPHAAGTDRGPSLQGVGRAAVDYMLTTGRMPIANPAAKLERRTPRYDNSEIAALEDYVASLAPGGPGVPALPPAAVADRHLSHGGALYRAQCAACHSWSGEGGALSHREAPPLVHATRTQVAEAVRLGPGTMPAFGQAALSDDDVAAVAAYVRYLDAPRDRGGLSLWHLGPLAEGAVAWVVGIGALLLGLRKIGTDK